MTSRSPYTRDDFGHSPLLVFYETTRACDLLCVHCRARAARRPQRDELSTAQARRLVDELLSFPRPPLLVLTGGDPFKREDVFELMDYAVSSGLEVAMTPSATPLVTTEAVARMKTAGVHRMAISLDGADAATHDGFRRVPGSFARTLEIMEVTRRYGLPVQINTTIARHNMHQIDAMADLLAGLGIVLWSIFFLIPTGRAKAGQRLSAEECELVFERIRRQSAQQPFPIKTTEAPHYRRFILEHAAAHGATMKGAEAVVRRLVGTNDGKGVMFISRTGEIFPSGFLPIRCGKFPADSIVRVYQESPLFLALRDPGRLGGKCGVCAYRDICGGSRSRAYALSGDPLAAEPDCAYVPPAWAGIPRE